MLFKMSFSAVISIHEDERIYTVSKKRARILCLATLANVNQF